MSFSNPPPIGRSRCSSRVEPILSPLTLSIEPNPLGICPVLGEQRRAMADIYPPDDLAGLEILIYAMNFAPEMTGCGRYTGEVAFELARRGASVTVVTSPPHYPGWRIRDAYRNRFSSEHHGTIRIIRCPVFLAREVRGWTRLAAPFSFALSSASAVAWELLRRRPHLVICVEPTLFAAPLAAIVARLCGTRSLLHVQDLEIDGAFEVGHLDASGPLPRLAFAFERFVLRRFDKILTISSAMRRRIIAKGLSADRVALLRNWVDLDAIRPLPDPTAYRAVVDVPPDHFVILYAGNLGPKQGLDLITRAARIMAEVDNLTFVIAGEGPERARLERDTQDLPNVRFLGLQPETQLGRFLNMPDVHVIPQLPNATDFALPSKLGGILASGRPLIVAANPGQELVEFLGDAAILVDPDDADALVRAIIKLMADRSDLAGPKRAVLAQRLSRNDAFDRLAILTRDLSDKAWRT